MSGAAGTASELVVHRPLVSGGRCTWTAALRPGAAHGQEISFGFTVDEKERADITHRADPFVLAALYRLMRRGGALRVRGAPVAASLLARLEELQRAWQAWKGLRPIEIEAEEEIDRWDAGPAAAVVAFSGGVDSAFTVWRHAQGRIGRRRRPLRAGIVVHGFDIPLDDNGGFRGAAARAGRMLDSVGVRLVRVATDIRGLEPDWEASHGLATAAALTLFAGSAGAGLIASSDHYGRMVLPWGSNPVTDWMMGSRAFEIVHDGHDASRFEKVRALCDWPQALADLRYCWVNEARDRNCGRCPKCAWTQLSFRALGVDPPCVDRRLSDEELRDALRTFRPGPFGRQILEDVWESVRERGRPEIWLDALEAVATGQPAAP